LVDELLATAAHRASPSADAISIVGAESHVPGRLVLLVSSTASSSDVLGLADATGTFELELDPALVTGQRLLASSANVALYEIEVGGVVDRGTVLGTARLRDGQPARKKIESSARSVVGADVTADWRSAPVALRLAVLGAEVASLPVDVSPAMVTSLRAELERLRAESDGEDARRADELLAVLRR
jgi:hypothetical protein